MSPLVDKRGRPYFVASIPFVNVRKVAFMHDFYNATATLSYREMMALARKFNLTFTTIWNWRHGSTFPKWDIAIDVIDWCGRGKPLDKMYQRDKRPNML